jgi:glycosyltransferase involved in cell wall biosynthesis
MSASIVLLTYNGEKYLEEVLQMIQRQKMPAFEIIAIDSGSSDSTLEILQKFRVRVHRILKSEFNHARTRNLGATMSSGQYIIFLTQDATPADQCWLEELLRPFRDLENVVGTYSKQIPRPHSDLLEVCDIKQSFPNQQEVKSVAGKVRLTRKEFLRLIHFSNSSSAYERQLLLQNPFREDLEMAEDQEWAKRVIEKGFTIVYQPESVVLHSHEHNLHEKYLRSMTLGRSFSKFLQLGRRSTLLELGAWLQHVLMDIRSIVPFDTQFIDKIYWLFRSPIHRAVTHFAFRKGWNSVAGAHAGNHPLEKFENPVDRMV